MRGVPSTPGLLVADERQRPPAPAWTRRELRERHRRDRRRLAVGRALAVGVAAGGVALAALTVITRMVGPALPVPSTGVVVWATVGTVGSGHPQHAPEPEALPAQVPTILLAPAVDASTVPAPTP